MIDSSSVPTLFGADVVDPTGDKVGSVGQVYLDSDTEQPTWVTVKTGLFGNSESFVPVSDADLTDGAVRVSFEKSFIRDAPRVDDDGTLSPEDEKTLFAYYGGAARGSHGDPADTGLFDQDADTASDQSTTGHDVSGTTTDDAMTRSEERLHVATETVETGRARLRKYVVTEQQSVTVPVSHEEVTLKREPITEANIGDATDGPSISEEEHELVLTGERVVTSKETVPVERVRLDTETVTEQETVTDEVRKEEIELVDPDTNTRTRN
ncbi:DUF2382 domain-containing protein [Marisediminicola senii]|uniref:DUF2382 domain-containing protein n=1 Tax=Marisediminicola senii TaxID=2711233 RepID=UPI0013EAE450|nr:PRC and DUF2382 domain-containing protein [Marisediminicola senii]